MRARFKGASAKFAGAYALSALVIGSLIIASDQPDSGSIIALQVLVGATAAASGFATLQSIHRAIHGPSARELTDIQKLQNSDPLGFKNKDLFNVEKAKLLSLRKYMKDTLNLPVPSLNHTNRAANGALDAANSAMDKANDLAEISKGIQDTTSEIRKDLVVGATKTGAGVSAVVLAGSRLVFSVWTAELGANLALTRGMSPQDRVAAKIGRFFVVAQILEKKWRD